MARTVVLLLPRFGLNLEMCAFGSIINCDADNIITLFFVGVLIPYIVLFVCIVFYLAGCNRTRPTSATVDRVRCRAIISHGRCWWLYVWCRCRCTRDQHHILCRSNEVSGLWWYVVVVSPCGFCSVVYRSVWWWYMSVVGQQLCFSVFVSSPHLSAQTMWFG